MRLRRLSEEGLEKFRHSLSQVRPGALPREAIPQLAVDPQLSEEVVPEVDIDLHNVFARKRAAAEYFAAKLQSVPWKHLSRDVGIWSWLGAAFFEQLCPRGTAVKHDAHYVFDGDYRRRYRHLLFAPVLVLRSMPDCNRLFLDGAIHVHGEAMEQAVSRLYMLRVPAVRAAIEHLYVDAAGQPKSGIFSKRAKRGDLRNRFVAKIQQLSRTYDLTVVSRLELEDLLGPEFQHWR